MMEDLPQRTLGILLFPRFDLLDVAGPVQAFGLLKNLFELVLVGEAATAVASGQGPAMVAAESTERCPKLDVLLVPGGVGIREQMGNEALLEWLRERADQAEIVLSVGTGSALLAKAGLLDGRRATSNKRGLAWVREQGPRVQWIGRARWVDDGKYVTGSGVAAGIDLALHLIQRIAGPIVAANVARTMEHVWVDDPKHDAFAV